MPPSAATDPLELSKFPLTTRVPPDLTVTTPALVPVPVVKVPPVISSPADWVGAERAMLLTVSSAELLTLAGTPMTTSLAAPGTLAGLQLLATAKSPSTGLTQSISPETEGVAMKPCSTPPGP